MNERVEEVRSRRKAFGARRSDRTKNAAQAHDRAWGWEPHATAGDVRPEQRFSGVRSRFSERMDLLVSDTFMNNPG